MLSSPSRKAMDAAISHVSARRPLSRVGIVSLLRWNCPIGLSNGWAIISVSMQPLVYHRQQDLGHKTHDCYSRAQCVDSDPSRGTLESCDLGKTDEGMFGGDVGRDTRRGVFARDTAAVDDAASILDMLHLLLEAVEQPGDVGVDQIVEVISVEIRDGIDNTLLLGWSMISQSVVSRRMSTHQQRSHTHPACRTFPPSPRSTPSPWPAWRCQPP